MIGLEERRNDNQSVGAIQDVISRSAVTRGRLKNRRTVMGLHHLVLIAFVFTLFVQIEAASTTSETIESLDAIRSLATYQIHSPSRRFLRRQAESVGPTEALSETDEERFGVKDATKMLAKGVEMKTKMKYWLFRKITPENILDKLKVTSATDNNYKYYSKYFFKYYGKNPNARPSDLPPHTTEDIMLTRIKNWFEQSRTPPQVFKELGFTGTFSSAHGLPNYEYFEMYLRAWRTLQGKLSPDKITLQILRQGP